MGHTFNVERSAVIDAPADVVYPLINDFHAWDEWSPWRDIDPDMSQSYDGPPAGPGAAYSWSGNRKAGAGRMQITDARPDQQVDIDLEFDKPFKAHNTTQFVLTPRGDRTEVTWRMEGPKPLVMRLLGPVFNMDKMVGKDFEKGLAQLQTVAAQRRGGSA